MRLSALLKETPVLKINGVPADDWLSGSGRCNSRRDDPEITSIHYRSQDVRPGGLFVAIEGHRSDGHQFIDDALKRGALVIVSRRPMKKNAVLVESGNTRRALSGISAAFYRHPSAELFVIGITGTNGKTTTAYLLESILLAAGCRPGVIGTINYRFNGRIFHNPVTTPESLDLQQILATMLAGGVSHVVMEVSSHAIALNRVDHCRFDIGVFTNLTQDHLDFHHDMQAYWNCKKKFFTELLAAGPKKDTAAAVINFDSANGRELAALLPIRTLTTGRHPEADLRPRIRRIDRKGTTATVTTPAGEIRFQSTLIGSHNLENILTAAGVGILLDISTASIAAAIESLPGVPGRLEPILDRSGRYIYIDYAHTPDALENVLQALRPMTAGRLICVFGCGGDRDKGKRPLMGHMAGMLCDLAVITSDNPRTEDPLAYYPPDRGRHPLIRRRRIGGGKDRPAGFQASGICDYSGPPSGNRNGHRRFPGQRQHFDRRQGARNLSDHRARNAPLRRSPGGAESASQNRRSGAGAQTRLLTAAPNRTELSA